MQRQPYRVGSYHDTKTAIDVSYFPITYVLFNAGMKYLLFFARQLTLIVELDSEFT